MRTNVVSERQRIEASRELLSAIGWAAMNPDGEHSQRVLKAARAANAEDFFFPTEEHREICEVLLEHIDVTGGATWSRVYLDLHRRGSTDALAELANVATAEGWPAVVKGHFQLLLEAAQATRRWHKAAAEVHELSGGQARIVFEGQP